VRLQVKFQIMRFWGTFLKVSASESNCHKQTITKQLQILKKPVKSSILKILKLFFLCDIM
jgi:hypothetical protein